MAVRSIDEHPAGLTWVIDEPVARTSHALVHDGRVWLIDPVDEPEAIARVAALGELVAVLQLLDRHGRDCAALAARLGVPHERVPTVLTGAPFHVVPVFSNRAWREVALWWVATGTLVVAEAIGTSAGFVPGPAGAGVHIGLRLTPPRRLGAYEPQHLLVGHGPALHGPTASVALGEALDRSRRDLPRALAMVPKMLVAVVRGG